MNLGSGCGFFYCKFWELAGEFLEAGVRCCVVIGGVFGMKTVMGGNWLAGGAGGESESDLFSDSLGGGERRGGR